MTQQAPNRTLSIYLAILLVLAPLWAPLGAAAAELFATTAGQMPCCPAMPAGPDHPAEHEMASADNCDHCAGGAPMGACQCCTFAASAAIPSIEVSTNFHFRHHHRERLTSVTLPLAPCQAPFRPPIST